MKIQTNLSLQQLFSIDNIIFCFQKINESFIVTFGYTTQVDQWNNNQTIGVCLTFTNCNENDARLALYHICNKYNLPYIKWLTYLEPGVWFETTAHPEKRNSYIPEKGKNEYEKAINNIIS